MHKPISLSHRVLTVSDTRPALPTRYALVEHVALPRSEPERTALESVRTLAALHIPTSRRFAA